MNKVKIMEVANMLIWELNCCDDEKFVDVIIDAVVSGNLFYPDEIDKVRGEQK